MGFATALLNVLVGTWTYYKDVMTPVDFMWTWCNVWCYKHGPQEIYREDEVSYYLPLKTAELLEKEK